MPRPGLVGANPVPAAPEAIDEEDREFLLALARTALGVAVRALPSSLLADARQQAQLRPLWKRRGAVFVTLWEEDELRGCVGVLDPSTRLPESIVEATAASALDDPRFWPVGPSEIAKMQIEISVLGPFLAIDDPYALRLGVDGVAIDVNGHRALLLPQVATEHGLDAAELWTTLCRKAAQSPDAWRRPGAHLLLFRTIHFADKAKDAEADT